VIRREGERLIISGPATLGQAAAILEQGSAQLREGVRVIDLGEVTDLDSSLLAMMLAWLREAKLQGSALSFARLPESLATIAGLYGVAELLPAAVAAAPATSH
jgi:phospholipid transport system transporter-binding protein